MDERSRWKRLIAFVISVALVFAMPIVFAGTAQASGQEGFERGEAEKEAAAPKDGFIIENEILKEYVGEAKKVVIPKEVKIIGENAFANKKITEVVFPDGLKIIGKYAFSGCQYLSKVTFPKGVTIIGEASFSHCIKLTEITLPESVTGIGEGAFSGCCSLAEITIPKNVSLIEAGAFEDCGNLENIYVDAGNSCYYVEDGLLYDNKKCLICCPGGKSGDIVIPKGVTNIGSRAFACCTWLEDITIPGSVANIGYGAFAGSNLRNVTISQGVKRIEVGAFAACMLESIRIPNSIKSIGAGAFTGIQGLENFNIPEGITSIDDGTFEGSDLKKIVIPKSVKTIGERAFRDCELDKVVLPESVTEIGEMAFLECDSLTSITIPKSVKKIGRAAFEDCSSLLTIYGKKGSYAEKYAKKHKIKFAIAKKTQSIKATREYNKTYKDRPFRLNVKLKTGNGKLTYASSDTKVVSVNGKGRVSIKGPGIAVITVKEQKTSKYNASSVKITVKVSPRQPQMRTVLAQGGQKIKVNWTRDKYVSGYEIQYSTDKEFRDRNDTKVMAVKNNRATSATIKQGLVKGEKYYVRMRSYKDAKAGKKVQKLYGAWSKAKTVVCK